MNRKLGVLVMVIGAASVAAAPPVVAPAEAPHVVLQPRVMMPQLTITHLQLAPGGYTVSIDNPTNNVGAMELHFKTQTIPFQSKAKAPVVVMVKDDTSALCNIGPLAFNLSGPNADTRVRHFEAYPIAYEIHGGVLAGGATPGDSAGKIALVSGGSNHWYGCDQLITVSAAIFNDTTLNPSQLKAELYDTDNTKIGEAPATLPPGQKTVVTVAAVPTTKLCGKEGNVRVHLVDPKSELGAGKMQPRDLLIAVTRMAQPVKFKLLD